MEVVVDGEQVPIDGALARLQDPDRVVRQATSEAVTVALTESLPAKAFVFNTLLYEKSVDDRLRSYPHWLSSRNLANEASDASVKALTDAVLGAAGIVRRWYRLKAKLLCLDRLADYDRFAPVFADDTRIDYEQARAGSRCLCALFTAGWHDRSSVLRGTLDRCSATAGEGRWRVLPRWRSVGSSLCSGESHRRAL